MCHQFDYFIYLRLFPLRLFYISFFLSFTAFNMWNIAAYAQWISDEKCMCRCKLLQVLTLPSFPIRCHFIQKKSDVICKLSTIRLKYRDESGTRICLYEIVVLYFSCGSSDVSVNATYSSRTRFVIISYSKSDWNIWLGIVWW